MQPESINEYISDISNERIWWENSNSTNIKMSKTYSFDKKTGNYTLTGDIINGSYTDDYIGYYTCQSTSKTSNCGYLIKIVKTQLNENNVRRIRTCIILSAHHTTTKKQAGSNIVDSQVKTKVDTWFKSNMVSLIGKISNDAGYCNDRTTISKDGGIGNNLTYFGSYYRNITKKIPSYKCQNESNDLFTMNETALGNKELIEPVGLISGDEITYAGGLQGSLNFRYFIHSGYNFWTLSPIYFFEGLNSFFDIYSTSSLSTGFADGNYGLRPVIALNSKAIVTSGDGSIANPYIVE